MIRIFSLILLFIPVQVCLGQDSVAVRFRFSGPANRVSVAGSFNGWMAAPHPLQQTGSAWETLLWLPPGYYYYKLVVDGVWQPDPSHSWRVNDGGDGWNSILMAGTPPIPTRKTRNLPFDSTLVPEPLYPARPDLIALYYSSWRLAWHKITSGTGKNGFVPAYLDEGFNDWIYQWDSCFMSAFALYGNGVFPGMESLDNFYLKQRPDGYIQRVYSEQTGLEAGVPTDLEPLVNPPLFAWMELRYYRITGDSSRLSRVFPVLDRYFSWLQTSTHVPDQPYLFRQTELGSGMDNVPRIDAAGQPWIDATAQMALFARSMALLAKFTGRTAEKSRYDNFYRAIAEATNRLLWSPSNRFYHDQARDGSLSSTMHAGAFWVLAAGIAGPTRNKALVEALQDPRLFNRSHRVPSLPFSDPAYKNTGHYWRGGVWAPIVFMTVQGLNDRGYRTVADSIAWNHLNNVASLFKNGPPDREKIPFEERYEDGYHTLWEAYSPEAVSPATRWDDTFYTRQDFTGWSALGPVALFLEQVIGIEAELSENRITWHLNGTAERGVRNLRLGETTVSLHAKQESGYWNLTVRSNRAFTMRVLVNGRSFPLRITSERTGYRVKATWN